MEAKSENRKAISAGLGYTIGNILVNGIAFISVPIFTRLMSTSDYGIYSSFMTYQSILAVVIGLALHVTLKNAKYDYPNDIDGYNSSILLLMLISTAIFSIVGILFQRILGQWLCLDWFLILPLIIYSSCSALLMFYNAFLALQYRYKEYLILSLFYSLGSIILSVVLIIFTFPSVRYLGRIWGGFIPIVIVGVIICVSFLRKHKPFINKEYWRYGIKISLPIIPHGLSQLVLTQFDRLMILRMIGEASAGIYSFAYTIAMILQIVYSSLDSIWTTWFFEMMNRGDRREIKNKSRAYVSLVSLLTIMFFFIAPEIIRIFSGPSYWEAQYIVIPIGLGLYFSFLYFFPAGVEYYYKKTVFIAAGTMMAAAINVILNFIFIPRYGYIIAAYTTFASYVLYFIFHIFIAYRLEREFVFDIKVILVCLFFTVISGLSSLLLIEYTIVRLTAFFFLMIVVVVVCYRKRVLLNEIIGRGK